MTSLDFSDLFKGGSLTLDDVYSDDNQSPALEAKTFDISRSDDSSWVLNKVEALGLQCNSAEITPAISIILQHLFTERDHWQSQAETLSRTCTTLKSRLDTLERNRDSDIARITVLTQDVNATNDKMSALKAEHREVKCLWLNEKSELESRCFQIQALHTQVQGTLRKKEKDYDRLQTQLTKLTKDATRGQKANTGNPFTPTMVLTQPLTKNSSQVRPGSLLDAEISAARTTIATLEVENSNLRDTVEDLTSTFEDFQAKMTSGIFQRTQPDNRSVPNPSGDHKELSCLEQARYVERKLDATTALLAEAIHSGQSAGHGHDDTNMKATPRRMKAGGSSTPSHRLIGQSNHILGSPAARPLSWVVQQASTEVKLLRQRAESLQWAIPATTSNENKENVCNTVGVDNDPASGEKERQYREKMFSYKQQLEQAIEVICEQDRLIHAALVGNLTFHVNEGDSTAPVYAEEEEDGEDHEFETTPLHFMVTPSQKSLMRSSFDPSDWSAGFTEMLPAVSPDTMAVLKASNFTTLPSVEDGIEPLRLMSSEDT